MSTRISVWASAEARRTYIAAAGWVAGSLVVLASATPDQTGWLRIRHDLPGLILLASALIGGWNFFPKGFRALVRLRLDMNFLMTAAIIGALLIGEPLEAAAIAALFSLAELLESHAVRRARGSIEELLRLAPERATRVTPDGEHEIAASELRTGDRVRVRPGEKIPIDGRIVDGGSAIDESTVTGESVPVTKRPGDSVYAGTLIADGYVEIEATTDAGDTTIDRIVQLVRHAQTRRAPSELFIQRFARYYTPAVTVAAVLTMVVPPLLQMGTGLEWFTRGLTLLVIACPCAMVIATPVTVVSALTSGARHGVLIKGGEYLEGLGRSRAFAFDKTGTLTEGRLTVTDVEAVGAADPDHVLALAAAVEARSEHPIAQAIVARAGTTGREIEVGDFRAHLGQGVSASVNGATVRIGTPELMPDVGVPDRYRALQRQGKTAVLVAEGRTALGIIALSDQPRPHAGAVIRQLRRLGLSELVMLTGDQPEVAHATARQLGIERVEASLLPEDKVRAVERLLRSHGRVAMLGDGVNDAPALATATVGMAMGAAGSPATIETADIALMADDLTKVPYAVQLARVARRIVIFNVALALALKLLLAAGAVAGVVSLMVAVLFGDMGASLAVTLNALRIARLGPDNMTDPVVDRTMASPLEQPG